MIQPESKLTSHFEAGTNSLKIKKRKHESQKGQDLSKWWVLEDAEAQRRLSTESVEEINTVKHHAIPVFNPNSRQIIAWNVLIALLVVEELFMVSFDITFEATSAQQENSAPSALYLNFAIDILFLMDVLVQFNTCYVVIDDQGNSQLVRDRWKIFQKYACFDFPLDLISSVPIDFILYQIQGQSSHWTKTFSMLKIFRFFKLIRAWRIGNFMSKLFRQFDINPAIILAMKLFTGFFGVTHGLSCLLFYIGTLTDTFKACDADHECGGRYDNKSCSMLRWDQEVCPCRAGNETPWCEGKTWLTETYFMMPGNRSLAAQDMAISNQYWVTLYWVVTTMATIGFGDIKPQTQYEIWTCILCQIIGAGSFGFIVGNMTTIAQLLNGRKEELTIKIDTVNVLLRDFKAPRELQRQAIKQIRHQFEKPIGSVKSDIIDKVPTWLGVDVAKEVFRNALDRNCIFNGLSGSTLDKLYLKLKPVTFVPGEYLFHSGSRSTSFIFVLNGAVHVTDQFTTRKDVDAGSKLVCHDEDSKRDISQEITTTILATGFLGENCLVSQQETFTYSARAADMCDLLYLSARDILHHFDRNSNDIAKVRLRCRLRHTRFLCLLRVTTWFQNNNASRTTDEGRNALSTTVDSDRVSDTQDSDSSAIADPKERLDSMLMSHAPAETMSFAESSTRAEKQNISGVKPGSKTRPPIAFTVEGREIDCAELDLTTKDCLLEFSAMRQGIRDVKISNFLGDTVTIYDVEQLAVEHGDYVQAEAALLQKLGIVESVDDRTILEELCEDYVDRDTVLLIESRIQSIFRKMQTIEDLRKGETLP